MSSSVQRSISANQVYDLFLNLQANLETGFMKITERMNGLEQEIQVLSGRVSLLEHDQKNVPFPSQNPIEQTSHKMNGTHSYTHKQSSANED